MSTEEILKDYAGAKLHLTEDQRKDMKFILWQMSALATALTNIIDNNEFTTKDEVKFEEIMEDLTRGFIRVVER